MNVSEKCLEWDEDDDDDDDWDEEDKNKSKLRRAWDKFIEFFARIFDKFLSIFKKKKKGEDEEEEEEEDPNRLITKMGINFWLYVLFLGLFIGFLVLIPLTTMFQNMVEEEIAVLESFQSIDFSEILHGWDYITDIIIQKNIDRLWDQDLELEHYTMDMGNGNDLFIIRRPTFDTTCTSREIYPIDTNKRWNS